MIADSKYICRILLYVLWKVILCSMCCITSGVCARADPKNQPHRDIYPHRRLLTFLFMHFVFSIQYAFNYNKMYRYILLCVCVCVCMHFECDAYVKRIERAPSFATAAPRARALISQLIWRAYISLPGPHLCQPTTCAPLFTECRAFYIYTHRIVYYAGSGRRQ